MYNQKSKLTKAELTVLQVIQSVAVDRYWAPFTEQYKLYAFWKDIKRIVQFNIYTTQEQTNYCTIYRYKLNFCIIQEREQNIETKIVQTTCLYCTKENQAIV